MKKSLESPFADQLCFDAFRAPYRYSRSQISIVAVSSVLSGTYRLALERDGRAKGTCSWIDFCIVSDRTVWTDF